MLALLQNLGHRVATQLFCLLYKFPVVCGKHSGQVSHGCRCLQLGDHGVGVFCGGVGGERRECFTGLVLFQLVNHGLRVRSTHGFEPVSGIDLAIQRLSRRGFLHRERGSGTGYNFRLEVEQVIEHLSLVGCGLRSRCPQCTLTSGIGASLAVALCFLLLVG